jgi:hypothetical protein
MKQIKEEQRCKESNPETGEQCVLPLLHEGLHKSIYSFTDNNGFKYEFLEGWEITGDGEKIVYPLRDINLKQILDALKKPLITPEDRMRRENELFSGGWKSFINMAIRETGYDIDPNKLAKNEQITILTKFITAMERKIKEWEDNYSEDPHLSEYIHIFRQEATIANIEISRLKSEVGNVGSEIG